jgi:hypothetical protein
MIQRRPNSVGALRYLDPPSLFTVSRQTANAARRDTGENAAATSLCNNTSGETVPNLGCGEISCCGETLVVNPKNASGLV